MQACFANHQFEHNAFQKCFSNLLAVGFRGFTVDTYWDPLRSVWSLCPVELPPQESPAANVPVQSGSTVVVSTDSATAQVPESTAVSPQQGGPGFKPRQDSSVTSSIFEGPSSTASPVSSNMPLPTESANPSVISFPTTSGPPLLQIGNYNCTSLMTLELLAGVLEAFLESTATTTGATFTLLTLNVHAAASVLDANGPAPHLSQAQLPVAGSLLSDVLSGNLSDDTYTPSRLHAQRADLNNSWYDVEWPNHPAQNYYRDSIGAGNSLFTHDGWPTETFMEFRQLYRLLCSYGTIDTQMDGYDIAADMYYVFPPGTLSNYVQTTFDTSGQLSSGCLFAPKETMLTSATNSSWTFASPPALNIGSTPDLMVPISAITNLTSCGLTAYLNDSLANATADKNPLPYAAFVHSTLWTWAPGQPLNVTEGSNTGNRCAVMTTSPYPGRWRVADCAHQYHVACQIPSQPYGWQISTESTSYDGADSVCGPNALFSTPRSALENAHLFAALQSHRQTAPNDDAVFINLNSLNVPDCWVVGLNGTCPYLPSTDTNRTRIVVVPTVAAVIIFLLAALTFFVKCAANRRENKRGRRRRLVGGWEYEGVPS